MVVQHGVELIVRERRNQGLAGQHSSFEHGVAADRVNPWVALVTVGFDTSAIQAVRCRRIHDGLGGRLGAGVPGCLG